MKFYNRLKKVFRNIMSVGLAAVLVVSSGYIQVSTGDYTDD